jgi:hypothetical protein
VPSWKFAKDCKLLSKKVSSGLTPYEPTKAARQFLTAISTKQTGA